MPSNQSDLHKYDYRFIGSGIMGNVKAKNITEAFDIITQQNMPPLGLEISTNETHEPSIYIEWDSWPEQLKQRLQNGT